MRRNYSALGLYFRALKRIPIVVAAPSGGGSTDTYQVHVCSGSTWVVHHNLGRKPIVKVLTYGGFEVEALIEHVDNNTLRVHMNSGFSGVVILL